MIAVLHVVGTGPWPGDDSPDREGFRDAVEIMLAMRRRIDDDVASGDDLRRYRLACAAAERIVRSRDVPRLAVDAAILIAVLGELSTIYIPSELPDHVQRWIARLKGASELMTFLADAVGRGDGLVLSIQPLAESAPIPLAAPPAVSTLRAAREPQPELGDALAALHRTLPVPFASERIRSGQAHALRRQIVDGLRYDQPVPIGMAASHDVIAEVLRELQHSELQRGESKARIRLVQVDGSESASFPIGLPARQTREKIRSIRLGLISMRHMKLDATVAGYWFRNRLVSVFGRTLAETEEFCFRDTLARLPELTQVGIDHVEIVHTGFEPAVIGFYRAVAEYVTHSRTHLAVTPTYARGETYVTGTTWLEVP